MQQNIRVRFAPSPTGHLHIGGFRTALFNYLFARHHNGIYVLRIEDTDLERSKQEYVDSIMATFSWSGIVSDEPVVIQSAYIDEHKALVNRLLQEGKAYRCYCTQEEVIFRYQKTHDTTDLFVKYDGMCRSLVDPIDKPYAVRFAIPEEIESVVFNDCIRGEVSIGVDQLDDFIIARSDGTPMYNFVVVADDARMQITHVIRGEEHIINTPKQILLYQAFGYAVPQFAHIPLILDKKGNKLSKRDAATSIVEYIEAGYLPDAFINYFARLGWSHGDQEIFSREELIAYFSLDNVGKKGAIFDQDKLDWINGVYMRAMSAALLCAYIERWIDIDFKQKTAVWQIDTVYQLIDLYKERVKTVKELANVIIAVAHAPVSINPSDIATHVSQETVVQLHNLIKMLEQMTDFTVDIIKEQIKQWCKVHGLALVAIAQPVRIALVGTISSPGIFDLLAIIGKQESIKRLQLLIAQVNKTS